MKRKYGQKCREQNPEFSSRLTKDKNSENALCKTCGTTFLSRIATIKSHADSEKHRQKLIHYSGQSKSVVKSKRIDERQSPMRTLTQVTKTLQLVRSATRNLGYLGAIGASERIMYPRKIHEIQKDPVIGGTPIGEESAVELRQIVFGSSVAPPRGEWLRTGFIFRDPDQEFAYGLKGSRNSTRGLLSVVQAHMIKYFLFDRKKTETVTPELLLKPNRNRQTEALWSALASIIWTVGEKKTCKVCLPRDSPTLQHSSTYFADGITETVHFFEFSALEDLRAFLKRYVYIFLQETGPGALLLLYSAILTRGLAKVKADMEDDKFYLVSSEEEGSNCIITLLLTGRATPYLHNGVVYVGDEDHYAMPQWGIMTRSDIGFLIYSDSVDCKNLEESKQPGSRLKTPSFPVWVVNCSGHYGILFNTNSELLRNYHAERRFDLHYFSVGGNHIVMSIDTRYQERQNENRDVGKGDENSSMTSSPMEKLIHTKWQDAYVNFNGMTPTF